MKIPKVSAFSDETLLVENQVRSKYCQLAQKLEMTFCIEISKF
jgi:hypothetical protein